MYYNRVDIPTGRGNSEKHWESLLLCTQQKGSFSLTICDAAFCQNCLAACCKEFNLHSVAYTVSGKKMQLYFAANFAK